MAAQGRTGALRGKKPRTTNPAQADARPADLVDRDFTATRPNQLWVVKRPNITRQNKQNSAHLSGKPDESTKYPRGHVDVSQ